VDISSPLWRRASASKARPAQFPQHPEGIAALAAFCQAHQVELVAMEATGGYEQQAFAQLSEQGLPVAILNPRAVRQFARAWARWKRPIASTPA
jgi:transposase